MHNGRLPTRSAAASFLLLPADEEVGEPGLKMSCFDPALATSPLWALIGGGKSDEGKTSTCSSTSCTAPAPLTCSACQAAHYCSRCCISFAPMLVEIKATFPSHFSHVHLLVGHLFSPHLPALRLFQKRRKSKIPISYISPGITKRPTGPGTNPTAPRLLSDRQRKEADTSLRPETLRKEISSSKSHH